MQDIEPDEQIERATQARVEIAEAKVFFEKLKASPNELIEATERLRAVLER